MNNKQLTALWLGVALIVLMCLDPVNYKRLVVHCVAVGLVTGAAIYTLRTKSK